MITARVNVEDHFAVITEEIELRTIAALNAAAEEAAIVADKQANHPKPIAHFTVLSARNVGDGYRSGVKAGPLTRIFDKGSLGKHRGALKRARAKPEWEVKRGTNPYTARRHDDLAGEGIAPRNILNPARKAGRAVLLGRLLGH